MEVTLHEICVAAVEKMVEDGVEKHVSYISAEDNPAFSMRADGKIPKVTIEWVDASEADPPDIARKRANQSMTDGFNQRLNDAIERKN